MALSLEELTALFKELGANDPEGWAHSEVQENIPQLARFVFLRQAWRHIVSKEDREWPLRQAKAQDGGFKADYADTLAALIDKGATPEELIDLVRGVQKDLLFDLCCLIDGASYHPLEDRLDWALIELDGEGNPTRDIGGLHESVFAEDFQNQSSPTG